MRGPRDVHRLLQEEVPVGSDEDLQLHQGSLCAFVKTGGRDVGAEEKKCDDEKDEPHCHSCFRFKLQKDGRRQVNAAEAAAKRREHHAPAQLTVHLKRNPQQDQGRKRCQQSLPLHQDADRSRPQSLKRLLLPRRLGQAKPAPLHQLPRPLARGKDASVQGQSHPAPQAQQERVHPQQDPPHLGQSLRALQRGRHEVGVGQLRDPQLHQHPAEGAAGSGEAALIFSSFGSQDKLITNQAISLTIKVHQWSR